MYNIMIVGVGGQGSLLASRVLGAVCISRGYDVKVSEVHGMSQRGGSVVTYVRAGEDVASPMVPEGECDMLISFEALEAYRYLYCLRKGGSVIVSTQEIMPMPVITGAAKYPENIIDKLKSADVNCLAMDAVSLAESAGTAKASNVVLLGAASAMMDVDVEVWYEAIKNNVPEKFVDENLRAFELGRAAAQQKN